MNENITETMETVPIDSGISSDIDIPIGNDDVTISDTSNADTDGISADTNADSSFPNVWNDGYNVDVDSVSSGDISTYEANYTEALMEIQEVNAENDTQIIEGITACKSLLVLIFAFLLMEWTEKKLKVAVNRFTDKRRH